MTDSTPAPEPRRFPMRRMVGLGLAVGLVLLVIAWLVGRWWLGWYLQSEQFRQTLNRQTAAALQAEGEFLPLHWTGDTVYSDGFHARGLPGSAVRELRVDQIRALVDVAGFWRRRWRVPELEIQRLQAALQPPAGFGSAGAGAPAGVPNLGPIRIRELNLHWPMDATTTGAVRRVQVVVTPTATGWEVSGSDGELAIPGWPIVRLGAFRWRWQGTTLYVTESQLTLADGGQLTVTGEVGTGGPAAAALRVRFADVAAERWLPDDWRGRLAGRAEGQSTVQGRLDRPDEWTTEGTVSLTDARLEALPILDRIAAFTRTEQFRRVTLSKARAAFARQGNRLTLRQIQLEAPGLLRIEGGCVVANEIVDGEFDLGIAASTLQWLPGARTRVFTTERDGYQWTKVRVQGPLRNIREDLSGRLVAAAGSEVLEDATGLLETGAEGFFDLLRKIEPPAR